jgi:prepilin-type N-terminal cleavage/methylation domain-containing protein
MRGFTLLELAIVLSIFTVVVPAGYLLARGLSTESEFAQHQLTVADATRAVSEELRRDAHLGALSGTTGLTITSTGACSPVLWRVTEDQVLRREEPETAGCGGVRALARRVRSLTREGQTVRLEFEFPVSPDDTRVTTTVIGLEGAR